MKTIIAFLKDENGQTSTEYILLLAVAALIVMKFKGVAQERLQSLTGTVFDGADSLANQIKEQSLNGP